MNFSGRDLKEKTPDSRKHLLNVIKNEGPEELLIWRHPVEDFNTHSTLIVMPGETAVFVKSGMLQTFPDGTHSLDSKNYPVISSWKNVLSGGVSSFSCRVYFVRSAESMEITWGTDSPIVVRDKVVGVATKIRARGSYRVRIKNSKQLLTKLFGSNITECRQEEISRYFINEFQSKIKAALAGALYNENAELIRASEKLVEYSEKLQPEIQKILSDYGLECVKFIIVDIDIIDDVERSKYEKIAMKKIEKTQMAYAARAEMDILGADWSASTAAGILKKYAQNEGIGGSVQADGGFCGEGAFSRMAGILENRVHSMEEKQTTGFRRGIIENELGGSPADSGLQLDSKLRQLKKWWEDGLISEEDYEQRKKEILDSII